MVEVILGLDASMHLGEPISLIDFIEYSGLREQQTAELILGGDIPLFVRVVGGYTETTPIDKRFTTQLPDANYGYEHVVSEVKLSTNISYFPIDRCQRLYLMEGYATLLVTKLPAIPLSASQARRVRELKGAPELGILAEDRIGHVWLDNPLEVAATDLYIFRADAERLLPKTSPEVRLGIGGSATGKSRRGRPSAKAVRNGS